jgi:hypothetical protein
MRILRKRDGVDPTAEWFVAEGENAPTMHRSIPVRKAMDDAMIVLRSDLRCQVRRTKPELVYAQPLGILTRISLVGGPSSH